MNVVGKVSSFITQGVYSVATPFHPFGGAVDIIVVQQQDGSFRSTPWYVRFGKFQGVLKGAEKVVRIEVNGVEANFHMYLDNSGEAYFIKEASSHKESETNVCFRDSDSLEGRIENSKSDYVSELDGRKGNEIGRHERSDSGEGELEMRDERVTLGMDRLERTDSGSVGFYEFQDEQSSLDGSVELSEYGSSRYDNLDDVGHVLESQTSSEVILVSVDGHVLTAPITSSEKNGENVQLDTPQFHLGPGEATAFVEGSPEFSTGEDAWPADYLGPQITSPQRVATQEFCNDSDGKNNGFEQQLESHDKYRDHHDEVQGVQDIANDGSRVSTNTNGENKTVGIRRSEVFKSCLELPQLAMQDENGNRLRMNHSSDSIEIAGNMKEGHLISPREVNSAEIESFQRSGDVKGLVLPSSDVIGSITSPDNQVNVDTAEKNTLDPNSIPAQSDHLDPKREERGGQSDQGVPEAGCTIRETMESQITPSSVDTSELGATTGLEISLCRNLLRAGMGSNAAADVFNSNRISEEEFKLSSTSIIKNENLVVRFRGKYLQWEKAAPIVLGLAAYGLDFPIEENDVIPVEDEETAKYREDESGISSTPSGRRWRLWPIPFRRVRSLEHTSSTSSNDEMFVDSECGLQRQSPELTPTKSVGNGDESPHKQLVRTNVPSSDQIASLNLKEGQNMVTFIFSTRVLGDQKVEAHIYLWKWNARIVISDVDGTITKSDVLGQFMPLVGKDWTHSGIARLFNAIKENGYQLLFLSARAIVQAYLTRSFLFNLKQAHPFSKEWEYHTYGLKRFPENLQHNLDGKTLPSGPVVISPDGLFPSLYREVIRRAPHEFKIACLEDIKALFPPDYNPFYAGFGNRDTDELSYRKIGIPKGKIFIINPKGEVAINHRIDVKSYTSLHTLVNDMFPPTSLVEQEDYNNWNFWRMPLPDVDDL